MKRKLITICPLCHSKDVSADFSNYAAVYTGLFNNIKTCYNCGHTGMIFPQVPKSKVPKKPKDKRKIKHRKFVQTIV